MDQEDTEPEVVDVQLSEAEPASPFYLVAACIDIPLAPRFQTDVHTGIEQVLAKWLTKSVEPKLRIN